MKKEIINEIYAKLNIMKSTGELECNMLIVFIGTEDANDSGLITFNPLIETRDSINYIQLNGYDTTICIVVSDNYKKGIKFEMMDKTKKIEFNSIQNVYTPLYDMYNEIIKINPEKTYFSSTHIEVLPSVSAVSGRITFGTLNIFIKDNSISYSYLKKYLKYYNDNKIDLVYIDCNKLYIIIPKSDVKYYSDESIIDVYIEDIDTSFYAVLKDGTNCIQCYYVQ